MLMVLGERFVDLNGVRHWIRVAGSHDADTTVVLIHGGPGANAYVLENSVGVHLEGTSRVVYYDQRGCGRSGRADAGAYSLVQLVADLEALRMLLRLDVLSLAGFSFGGQLAAEYALAHPDRTARLILAAPSIAGPLRCPGRLAGMDAVADDPFRVRLRAYAAGLVHAPGNLGFAELGPIWSAMDSATLARIVYADPDVARTAPILRLDPDPRFAEAVLGERRSRLLIDDLATLHTPTLVTVGLYDRTVGVDACRDLVDRMPRAQLAVLDRCGHNPVEQCQRHAQYIVDFLADPVTA